MTRYRHSAGYTLIEIMIAVAIVAVLAGIAIPAYNNYIIEARIGAARMNTEPLRLALEDYWLDNQTFADFNNKQWDPKSGTKTLYSDLGWRPDGDDNAFKYEIKNADATGYTIEVTHLGSGHKITCTKQAACTY